MHKIYTSRQLYAIAILGSILLALYTYRAWNNYRIYNRKETRGVVWAEIKGDIQDPGIYGLKIGKNFLGNLIRKAGGIKGSSRSGKFDLKIERRSISNGDSWIIRLLPSGGVDAIRSRIKGATAIGLGLKMPINSASKTDLLTLPLMTEKVARTIILYRQKYGPFKSFAQLKNLPGVTERRIKRWKPYLSFEK